MSAPAQIEPKSGNADGTGRKRARRRYRVAAVVPCYNRAKDVEVLLQDFSRLDTSGVELWVVVVDNASAVPLSTVPTPPNVRVEHLRLETNTGGAGGFNAGMTRVLAGEGLSGQFDPPDFLWLVDSDARVSRRCLRELVRAITSDHQLAAVGSALTDQVTGQTYEIGGKLLPMNGYFVPAAKGDVDKRELVQAEYLAACSALVRREAIEKTGLMPEIFIHGDDVEWFLQMTRKTGMKVAGAPKSHAYHPLWSRKFQTWVRYYTTRNAYAPIDACGFGGFTRFYRAAVDSCRAMAQAMMGMPELADLHLQGMAHAAEGKTKGFGPTPGIPEIAKLTKVRPFAELSMAVRAELAKRDRAGRPARLYWHPLLFRRHMDFEGLEQQILLLGVSFTDTQLGEWKTRALHSHRIKDTIRAFARGVLFGLGRTSDVAVVPTGWPTSWFRGRTLIQVTSDGFLIREIRFAATMAQGLRTLAKGLWLACRLGLRRPHVNPLPQAPKRAPTAANEPQAAARVGLTGYADGLA